MKKVFYHLSPFVMIPVWVLFINLIDQWNLSIIPYIFMGGPLALAALIGGVTPATKKVDLRITFFVPLAFFLTMFVVGFFDTGTCSGDMRLDIEYAFKVSLQPLCLLIYVLMALITFLVSFLKIRLLRRSRLQDKET